VCRSTFVALTLLSFLNAKVVHLGDGDLARQQRDQADAYPQASSCLCVPLESPPIRFIISAIIPLHCSRTPANQL